jgi:molybdopterin synthase catalytic subunit
MSFRLTAESIDAPSLTKSLADSGAGACVTFEGWVRNTNENRKVDALEYEAFGPLAEREAARVIEEAKARYGVISITGVHRVGLLKIGEIAVWIGVASAHRGPGFDACRYVIDELKARVPIWKKEHYQEGPSEWINCATRTEPVDPPKPALT